MLSTKLVLHVIKQSEASSVPRQHSVVLHVRINIFVLEDPDSPNKKVCMVVITIPKISEICSAILKQLTEKSNKILIFKHCFQSLKRDQCNYKMLTEYNGI